MVTIFSWKSGNWPRKKRIISRSTRVSSLRISSICLNIGKRCVLIGPIVRSAGAEHGMNSGGNNGVIISEVSNVQLPREHWQQLQSELDHKQAQSAVKNEQQVSDTLSSLRHVQYRRVAVISPSLSQDTCGHAFVVLVGNRTPKLRSQWRTSCRA
jgi:hypothetical protein